MPHVDLVVRTDVSRSHRARQIEALFDMPASEKSELHWKGNVPLEERPWQVGLIVGPSGCGKTSLAHDMFKEHMHPELVWGAKSVIDDFDAKLPIQDIASACSSVGFNTMPAWLRPHAVLSNGEKFRVDLARRLLELPSPVVVDEFTSVVDRQVAKIGSHAVAKWVRREKKQFVAVSCHYDIIDWLQPDWVLEPATMTFQWRSLRRRPSIDVDVARVPYSLWELFAPYHYLTRELNYGARCFAAFIDDRPVAFAGIIYFPHSRSNNLKSISRVVTLPDWQGLGLAFVLLETLGAAYKAAGWRLLMHPAHPGFIRSFDRSKYWKLTGKPHSSMNTTAHARKKRVQKARPCASFEYNGPGMDRMTARRLLQDV